jgi:CubicO group peptidase (beta-lactamase class C family)
MKKQTIPALLLSLLLLIIANQAIAQAEKAETEIQAIMQSTPVIGLAVAVVKNNKVIYNHSFGLKDAENKIPLNNQSIFRIASISKSLVN